jgi:hypothetical protein
LPTGSSQIPTVLTLRFLTTYNMSQFKCDFCPRQFRTARGLKSHQREGKCSRKLENSLGVLAGGDAEELFPHDAAISSSPVARKRASSPTKDGEKTNAKRATMWQNLSEEKEELSDNDDRKMAAEVDDLGGFDGVETSSDEEPEDNDAFFASLGLKLHHNNEEEEPVTFEGPILDNRDDFRSYCMHAKEHFAPLDSDKAAAVRLLDILRRKKAPLDAYNAVMTWHLREKGTLLPGETVGQSGCFTGRDALIKFLTKRYHMEEKFPFVKSIVLPHSHASVNVVCYRAAAMVESLLTDPRLQDDDLSFYDDNPLADPPKTWDHVGDLNTGLAFLSGYRKYKTKPKQVPIGIQWYIDGAVTGQFENLQIVALKMTLSCFTKRYRMKDHAWRTLGYVVSFSKAGSRGKKIFVESKHMDSEILNIQMPKQEGEKPNAHVHHSDEKSQDFHAQLKAILETFLDVQDNGMMWDLPYRGRLYKDLHLVFFSLMVKCDTDEAEVLCGKYRSKSGNVKQLCQYCPCPNEETDDPLAVHDYKTLSMIKKLVADGDLEGLKAISQHNIRNAWYKVRFSPVNDRGIHGATPSEMLHAVLLGIFKYLRECFFAQVQPTSQLALEINALAAQFGVFFGRQSERDLPKCKFGHGIHKGGKLMAKEYRGVLLVIAAVLRSTKGQELLSKKNKNFAEGFLIRDWLLLVETLLQWEAYLCQPRMKVDHIKRMEQKNRFIMHLFLKVGRRTSGMGFRLMKFHAIIHMVIDILLFGVPMEHDTGANESHHKGTKVAARLTQKKASTFELQTATRMTEFSVVDLAMDELRGRKLWRYYEGFAEPTGEHTTHAPPSTGEELPSLDDDLTDATDPETDDEETLGPADVFVTKGTRIMVFENEYGDVDIGVKSRMKDADSILWDEDVRDFLFELQELVSSYTNSLRIMTEHHRNGQIFRAHPEYRQEGKWRDWVMVDWGEDGKLPAEIWCFVVLEGIDEDAGLNFGGIDIKNGTYAVIESAFLAGSEKERSMSDIFTLYEKEVASLDKDGVVVGRSLYLADVDAFVSPLCMIPDVGANPRCRYLQVKPRSAWVEDFIDWLEDPHENDDMTD